MTHDTEDLLRDFFQRETTQLPESLGSPFARLSARAKQRRKTRLAGVSAATAALVIICSGAAIAIGHPGSPAASSAAPAVLPARMAPPSAPPSVLNEPIPRAVALIETSVHGDQQPSIDPILVTAAGAYRTVPLRHISSDAFASYSLSPDGTRLAIGIYSKPAATIAILTLESGDIARYTLRGANPLGENVTSIAWAPNGDRLAYWASITTAVSADGTRWGEGYDAGVLDLATGGITTLPAPPISWFADGQHLLLSNNFTLEMSDATGGAVRPIDLGSLLGVDVAKAPLSPNGQLIALISREGNQNDAATKPHNYTLDIRPITDAANSSPAEISLGALTGQPEVICWAGDHDVIVGEPSTKGDVRIQAIDISTGATRVITDVVNAGARTIQLPTDTVARLGLPPRGTARTS